MVHCLQNIWFNKRMHPNEQRNGHQLLTKWALAWPVALGTVSRMRLGVCRKGCALIRQLAN